MDGRGEVSGELKQILALRFSMIKYTLGKHTKFSAEALCLASERARNTRANEMERRNKQNRNGTALRTASCSHLVCLKSETTLRNVSVHKMRFDFP